MLLAPTEMPHSLDSTTNDYCKGSSRQAYFEVVVRHHTSHTIIYLLLYEKGSYGYISLVKAILLLMLTFTNFVMMTVFSYFFEAIKVVDSSKKLPKWIQMWPWQPPFQNVQFRSV